ncbi:MAG: PfkB family carbohydrate kinase [Acidimicrobiia bacterium]
MVTLGTVIVCCGDAIVDVISDAVPGGSNLNTAVAAARLGAPTAFLGRISTDADGAMLVRHLEDSGVDLRLVERGPEPTARAIVTVDPTPSFRFEADGTAEANLESASLDVIGPGPHIIQGGTFGMYRGATAATLHRLIADNPGLVVLDPNVRPSIIPDRSLWDLWHERWLDHTALYRCSNEDLDWIWGGRSESSVAGELLDRGIAAVVVTSADGCTIHTAGWDARVPGVSVEVVDTVGAGDTFTGTLLAGLHESKVRQPEALRFLNKASFVAAAEAAVIAAGFVCTRQGADPPWKDELREFRARLGR